jgi:serine protease Do
MMKLAMFALTVLAAAGTAIAEPGSEEAGYLGVRLQRVEGGLAEALNLKTDSGVLLGQVIKGSPAETAGLKEGDIVVALDGQKTGTPDALREAIHAKAAGNKVALEILRGGKKRTVQVALGKAEASERVERSERRERSERGKRSERPMRDRFDRHVREMRLGGEHGWLGVHTQPLSKDLGEFFGAKNGGALVSEVVADSPAAKLGLKAGDVITAVDDEAVEDPGQLRRIIGKRDEAGEVQVTWLRDRREQRGKTMLEMREGFALLEGMGDVLSPDAFHWTPGDGEPMRERVHAFRMRAGEETEKALAELKEQVKKLEAQVRKLEQQGD